MAMANDSTKSMGSRGMFDAYIVLFTFLAHICLFAKSSMFALPWRACSNAEYFTPNFRLIRALRFLLRV